MSQHSNFPFTILNKSEKNLWQLDYIIIILCQKILLRLL